MVSLNPKPFMVMLIILLHSFWREGSGSGSSGSTAVQKRSQPQKEVTVSNVELQQGLDGTGGQHAICCSETHRIQRSSNLLNPSVCFRNPLHSSADVTVRRVKKQKT